ncbi:receptor-like protein 6 [Ziziphus jujuba]|uniref:Receptor-like protein 6 n=1 Tax=Ziziphus jujuba TaxID=326968 RepID=A0A6P6FPA5_ZIZJJ|nr:receptor-like protein 6 [Ziziphus jujuba]
MKFWNSAADCCSWDGVLCNKETGHVLSLDLSNSWIYGPLLSNSSLFNLQSLRKLNLAFNNFSPSPIPSEFHQLSRLTHLNLSFSMFSGFIPSQISRLTRLVSLDLSFNINHDGSLLKLREGELGKLTKSMTNLRQLHLNLVNLSSSVPEHIGNLSSLTHLSFERCLLHGQFPKSIFQLPKIMSIRMSGNSDLTGSLPEFHSGSMLKLLDLSKTSFSGKLPVSIGKLRFLNFMDLKKCSFLGVVPSSLWNLSELSYLRLSSNHFNGQLPYRVGNLAKLTTIDLSGNQFSGELPSSLGNLTQLTYLFLDDNNFSGQIPSSLGNLSQLEMLKLSTNLFDGKFPSLPPHQIKSIHLQNNNLTGSIPSTIQNLTFLECLDLSYNSFTGVIPWSLFKLPSLAYLSLKNNQLSGSLNIQNISDHSSKLENLFLSKNNLTGHIPSSISKLKMLKELCLDSNDLSGSLDFDTIFLGLSSLHDLLLSNNRGLSVTNNVSRSSSSCSSSCSSHHLPKLHILSFSSCNISEFPMFLKTQDELESLNFSHNRISGPIPKWFLNIGTETLKILDLSYNNFSGWEEPPLVLPWKKLYLLDLHSNMLRGPVAVPPMSTRYFSLSGNSLVGRIDPLFCKLGDLQYLDLSSNNLSGTIPQCLGNFNSSLLVVNLRINHFHGKMPQTCGDRSKLKTLDLSCNQLYGKMPSSLIKCEELQILNLSHNQLNDTFPFWLQSLLNLQVLILAHNKFHGPICCPHNFSGFLNLSIIDLSFNDFSGSLSSEYFTNWTSMSKISHRNSSGVKYIGDDESYQYSVTVVNKGLEMLFVKIFTMFVCIDFSNNIFHGEIPETIGDLQYLIVLNLSSNNFSGHIPSSLRNLVELESLDLSNNKLSGKIPPQLTSLTFLEYLNVSKNQLTGPIPQAGQIGIFPNSSFEGNAGLCGLPLSKKCGTLLPPSQDDEELDSVSFSLSWKAVVIGYGGGLIIGLIAGHIITSRRPSLMFKIFGVIPQRRRR